MKRRITVRRLLRLANHLDKLSPVKFDMGEWGKNVFDDEGVSCGTVCCAGGHSCLIPTFRKLGLKLTRNEDSNDQTVLTVRYGSRTSWGALEEFYDLGFLECLYIFDLNEYPSSRRVTPKVVARRIRRFVAKLIKGEKATV